MNACTVPVPFGATRTECRQKAPNPSDCILLVLDLDLHRHMEPYKPDPLGGLLRLDQLERLARFVGIPTVHKKSEHPVRIGILGASTVQVPRVVRLRPLAGVHVHASYALRWRHTP